MAKTLGKVAIVGAGVMGQAIADALLKEGLVTRQNMLALTRSSESASKAGKRLGIRCLNTLKPDTLSGADIVILAVKPFQAAQVLRDISQTKRKPGSLLISVVTGLSTCRIEELLGGKPAVIRAITNTPCVVGAAMTALVPGSRVTHKHKAVARSIFEAAGQCIEIEERLAEAMTGLSSSGPAYLYLIMEALADGGVRVGIPRDTALKIAAQTAAGAARMVMESGRHPASLRDDVTTPAGCTIAGLLVMEDGRLRSTLARAVEEATKVARDLGKLAT